MFGGEALAYWLTLWLSLQLSLDDLGPNGLQRVHYDPVPEEDVHYWTRHMAEVMLQFGDDEVEFYLPQLVTVLTRRDAASRNADVTSQVSANLGAFLLAKCRSQHNVGMRLLWQLRAAARDPAPLSGFAAAAAAAQGGAVMGGGAGAGIEGIAAATGASLARILQLESWVHDFEMASKLGDNLPEQLRQRRIRYHTDCMRFVERLVLISHALRHLSPQFRLRELQVQLGELNKCLLRRMQTRGRAFERDRHGGYGDYAYGESGGGGGGGGGEWLDESQVANDCPEAAQFALHLPLRVMAPGHGGHRVMRVLRIAKELCCVLPSRERAPYLVVAEVLQTTLKHGSDRVYAGGGRIGLLASDIVERRTVPAELLHELQEAHGAAEWAEDPAEEDGGNAQGRRDMGRRPDKAIAEACEERDEPQEIEEAGELSEDLEGDDEREDRAFFSRAFAQYLGMGNSANPFHQRMRLILTQVFENMSDLRERVFRQASPFGRLKGWRLATFIVKAGDDVRQEALAMQVITLCHRIFRREGLSLWLRPYSILCVGNQAGLVECIPDAKSIDHIKKKTPNFRNMRDFFDRLYMGRSTGLYGRAQDNFVRSLAGYSIITYVLQVKDRHNANIMMDNRGHIIHIDFGFILGASPGMWKHETAPFKLTQDYLDIMGGEGSHNWNKFRDLFLHGFKAVRKHTEELVALVKAMAQPNDRRALIQAEELRRRLEDLRSDEAILALISRSINSWTTQQYDLFQYVQNNIAT